MKEETFETTLRVDLEMLNAHDVDDALAVMYLEIEAALEEVRASMQHWADMLLVPETA